MHNFFNFLFLYSNKFELFTISLFGYFNMNLIINIGIIFIVLFGNVLISKI